VVQMISNVFLYKHLQFIRIF